MSFGILGLFSPAIFAYELAQGKPWDEALGIAKKGGSGTDPFFGKPDMLQLLMFAGIMKLSKTPEGLKVLEKIGVEFTKGIFKTLSFLGQASAANPVAAWANPILISGVLERFGFLPPAFNANYHLGITFISGVNIYEGILNDVANALPWNAMKPPENPQYPSAVTFAGEMGQLGWDQGDIVDLAKAIQPRTTTTKAKVVKK